MNKAVAKTLAIFFFGISFLSIFSYVFAAGTLTGVAITLSSDVPITSSNHTLAFSIATDETIKQVSFQYTRSNSNFDMPANLVLANATLNNVTGLDSGAWTMDKTDADTGYIKLNSVAGEALELDDGITVQFDNITNPEIEDCSITGTMYDECSVFIRTYSDSGTTLVDSASISYRIADTATLSFHVDGVAADTVTSGITTNITTTFDAIPFGKLLIRQPVYGAQKLYVETTGATGYFVEMKLDGYIQGLQPRNKIDPFAGLDVAWTTPGTWSSPNGVVDGEGNTTDTGWIGANTSDTRVTGWSNASAKFGPVSSTAHIVMQSDIKDYGTYAYVTYVIEVNEQQPPDLYAGEILYSIVAKY